MPCEKDNKRRKLSLSKSAHTPGTPYNVDTPASARLPRAWKCGLSIDDKNRVQQCRWLNDNLITVTQSMLAHQFGVPGLQDVTLMHTLSMDVQRGEFVQILNVSQTHWITISTVGCQAGFIKVYDSGGKYITYRNKEEIASKQTTGVRNHRGTESRRGEMVPRVPYHLVI